MMKSTLKKLLATTFLVTVIALPVQAQDEDLRNVIDRLDRMDRDIKALNLKVYRGTDVTPSSDGASAGTGEAVSGPLAARLSVRINELESQLRAMNGQIEETAYRISQLNTRLDKLVADVDYRLTVLEGGNPAVRPPQATNAQGQSQTPATPNGVSAQQLGTPSTATQGNAEAGTLGTLNGQDLTGAQTSTAQPGEQAQQAAAQAAADLTPEALYQKSRQMLMRSEFANAESSFKAFLDKHKSHELAGNARYWLGETYYVQGNYAQAAGAFLEGYQKDTRGAKAPDSLLKLGMSLSRMEKTREACASFDKLRSAFPKLPAHLSKTLERERTNAKCG
ncbi:tol-pal system protein YbgF [Terasakiella pusilla]|uniref:tol-pal system protein YbgF n=1 Tax=Terasakiella pusilla TaxID=64973 RepID=UPI003AA97142